MCHCLVFLVFAFAFGFPSCSNVSISSSERCVWSVQPFVDELVVPSVWENQSTVFLDAKLSQMQFHASMPLMFCYGYDGRVPGPTLVVTPGATLKVVLRNSLPKKHLLKVDLRVHHVYSDEPLLTFHLHGAQVRARFDGQPNQFLAPGGANETRFFQHGKEPESLFYHDHAHGITRLNVIMGLFGAYVVADSFDSSHDIPLMISCLSFSKVKTNKFHVRFLLTVFEFHEGRDFHT